MAGRLPSGPVWAMKYCSQENGERRCLVVFFFSFPGLGRGGILPASPGYRDTHIALGCCGKGEERKRGGEFGPLFSPHLRGGRRPEEEEEGRIQSSRGSKTVGREKGREEIDAAGQPPPDTRLLFPLSGTGHVSRALLPRVPGGRAGRMGSRKLLSKERGGR